MKRIILEKDEATIELQDITENDVIIVKKDGEIIGTITHGNSDWICVYIGMLFEPNRTLKNAMALFEDADSFYCL